MSTPHSPLMRKRVLQPDGLPLRIQIPPWDIDLDIPEATPTLGSSSESESDEVAEPTTPRIGAISPHTCNHDHTGIVARSPSVSPSTSDEVDGLRLGSLRIANPTPSPKSHTRGRPRAAPGPIVFMKALTNGSQGCPFVARDRGTSAEVCAKVFWKRLVRTDRSRDLLRGMLAEIRAYKRIAAAEEGARNWLMELHGVVQDGTRILFVMVCRVVLLAWCSADRDDSDRT